MDKRTFAIGVLSVSAVVLFAANMLKPQPADASLVIKDNEYTAITARIARGGEALYLLDNRTGNLCVMWYDPGRRSVVPLAPAFPLMEAFGNGPGMGAGNGNATPPRNNPAVPKKR